MKTLVLLIILFSINAEASYDYLIYKDNKDMTRCLEMTIKNKKINLFIFADFLKSPKLRKVYYSKIEQNVDENFSQSLCSNWQNFSNVYLRQTATELDSNLEDIRSIGEFSLTEEIKLSIKELSLGFERFIPKSAYTDKAFLNNLFEPFKIENHKKLLSEVGEKETTKLYHAFIKIKNIQDNCSKYIGSCDYYLCREKNKSCGSEGYFLGFGYQYCSDSLKRLVNNVSPIGQKWMHTTATCLQKQMQEIDYSMSCGEIKKAAVESHDKCYSEVSFCSLKLTDMTQVLEMIGPSLSENGVMIEGIQVLAHCAGI